MFQDINYFINFFFFFCKHSLSDCSITENINTHHKKDLEIPRGGGVKSQDFHRNVHTKTGISRGMGNGFQTLLWEGYMYEYFLEILKRRFAVQDLTESQI